MEKETQRQMEDAVKTLEEAEKASPTLEAFIDWLKGAFHAHSQQVAEWRKDFDELRKMYLASKDFTDFLSVREGQLLRVCRICRGSYSAPFVLNYGAEFAHEKCLSEVTP